MNSEFIERRQDEKNSSQNKVTNIRERSTETSTSKTQSLFIESPTEEASPAVRIKHAALREPEHKAEKLRELMNKTPARIGVGRAGVRPKTKEWLKFRYDHAAAVDAVYGQVSDALLEELNLFKVNTQVADKETYMIRPDYGRKLAEEAKQVIRRNCEASPTVQIILSNGLSASAVEENAADVYLSLQQALISAGHKLGTPFYIENGRVAVMDDVGEILRPEVIVLLIGERPGLGSAESLSAYLCYRPRSGTIEAERMVVSNIHKGGIPPVEAGAYISTVVEKVVTHRASGVSLARMES